MDEKQKLKIALSKTVLSWRQERDMSQEDFAALCDLRRPYISRIESRRQMARLYTLYKILKGTGKSFADLGRSLDEVLFEPGELEKWHEAAEKGIQWDENDGMGPKKAPKAKKKRSI